MYTSLGFRKPEVRDLSVLGPGLVDHGDHRRLPRKGFTGRSWENRSKELIENQGTVASLRAKGRKDLHREWLNTWEE